MYISKLSDLDKMSFGGKAEALSVLINSGFPVPSGYAVAAEAFENGTLRSEAEQELMLLVKKLPAKYTYAVRSSADGEDGEADSFAGAYETVLDVPVGKIPEAVEKVACSVKDDRVGVYANERNIGRGKIAVIIQRYVPAEFAGVIFTADAITAGTEYITGNYVRGKGEELVSGESFDGSFRINSVSYSFNGSPEIEPYAKKMYSYARKAVKIFGCELDMEWAVSRGKLYILQARPITTIYKNNYDEFEINDSLCGELLLSKTNVGEIFLRPVSPVTYGVLKTLIDTLGIPLISNVCGQLYLNISGLCSMVMSFGLSKEKAFKAISELAGGIPSNFEIPVYSFNKKEFLKKILGLITGAPGKNIKKYDFGKNFKKRMIEIGNGLIDEIRNSSSAEELSEIWSGKCEPYMMKTLSTIATGLSLKSLFSTRAELEKVCGAELADMLLSDSSGNGNIESIGYLLAIDDVVNGRMSQEEYTSRYGHRHADELELSMPYPYEDPDFPENAVRDYVASGINAYEMKTAQELRHKEAVARFKKLYPSKSAWLDKLLKKYSVAVYDREKVRSNALRLFCVIREYLLKAGEFTGLKEDIFMLYLNEVKKCLTGQLDVTEKITVRRRNYTKQMEMPNFPSIICGRFTFEEWKKSGGATGFYRFGENCSDETDGVIRGVAGSCGQAEGVVRVMNSIDEADSFQKGEILVVKAANIGWIKLFPKISALVTDIGAPLSHAVIVARELGIPAVVSCQYASGVLKTGDRVRVDGTAGKVTLLDADK